MTLRELIAANPDRFLAQTWYDAEPFMDIDCPPAIRLPAFSSAPSPNGHDLPRAAMLAQLYLLYPAAPIWEQYLWCKDTDRLKQRIYVGGVSEFNGRVFEVHRHLHVTPRWGVATW